jgi:glycosyltransferase involved in cell wall biosynthesis
MQIQMPLISYHIDYSIVICTYNPDERLLKRCLNAVYNLDTAGITMELLLADNSSLIPVEGLPYVREYVRKIPSMKTIMVAVQGVNYARIAAVSEAKGKYIIYFDDDNEPASNYLQELKKLNAKYPQVAALGPGDVTVDFIDGIDKSIESYARIAFRERHEETIKFSRVCEWQPCYPFGSGLCTYTVLLKEYINLLRQGKFTMPGRKDKELTSGEDMQMVLLCISKGYFAGVSPTLQIKHIIPKARANDKYLQRLVYGTGICFETSLVQVFPTHKNKLKHEMISQSKFSVQTLKKFIEARLSSDHHKIFDLVQFIALNAGVYLALHKPVPAIVKRIVKYLKLE